MGVVSLSVVLVALALLQLPGDGPVTPRGPSITEADRVPVGQGVFAGTVPPGVLVDEVLPAGPDGTGTTFGEPIQYQLGSRYDPTGRPHPMLVAYHGFGASAKSVAAQSTLDEECNERGWVYLSVTGLDDRLFGTAAAQQHVEAAVGWMLERFHVDPDRIAMVGFSMGAGVTMNFAARHRDPDGIVLAGIGLVSAAGDWTSTWTTGGAGVKSIMETPLNFGAPPSADPFAYRRWSATFHAGGGPFGIGSIQPHESMASNLGATPVYLTWDFGDPTGFVADQCSELAGFLPTLGGDVLVDTTFQTVDPDTGAPAPHSWAVLDEAAFFGFLEGRVADRRPRRVRVLTAEDRVVGRVAVAQRQGDAFSRLEASVGEPLAGEPVEVSGVANVARVDVRAGGPAARRVDASGADAQPWELGLGGFASRPSHLLTGGTATLVEDVRSEPWDDALVATVPPDGLVATVVSRPDWTATLTVTPDPAPPGARVELLADGPAEARSAWLVVGAHEALVPVLGVALLGVDPRPPSWLRLLPTDAAGDLRLAPFLPTVAPAVATHLHVQALFRDEHGAPVATSNSWMLRLD